MATVIRGDQIKDLTIEDEDIAPETITGDKIAAATISGVDIAPETVSEDKLSITGSPVDGYYLKYTTAGGMVWSEVTSTATISGIIGSDTILTSSGSYSGEFINATVDDASAVFGDVIYCAADFHYERADADSISTMPAVAMVLENGSGSKKILLRGQVCNTGWNWVSGTIYVHTDAGKLTQTVVSGTGDQVQAVGFALSAYTIYFNPNLVLIEIQ
jgi:hypothetical protein